MDFRTIAISAAKAASQIIRDRYMKPYERIDKKYLDFATDADIAAEREIVQIIARAFPSHSILAEEAGWAAGAPGHHFTWLIDPLCGTLNFAAGLPFFCVNIALLEGDRPILGVVAEPLAGAVLWATSDGGAYRLRSDGQEERLQPNAASRIVALDLGSDPTPSGTQDITRLLQDISLQKQFNVRMLATSLAFPYLACGSIAAIVDYDTGPVHLTAGAFISQQAGCVVTDSTGAPWTPNCRRIIAAADSNTHVALKNFVASSR